MIDVSIVIITYNYANFLPETLKSCLFQKNTNLKYEIIVIDDGSSDNTQNVLTKFNDQKLEKYLIDNSGIEKASNYGFMKAKGKYIVRVDADDMLHTNYLSRLESEITKDYGFFYTDYFVINHLGKITQEMNLPIFNKFEILKRGDFLATGTLYSSRILKEFGYYSENFKNSGLENYRLILEMISKNVLGKHICENLFYYRRHSGNISSKKLKQIFKNGQKIFDQMNLGKYITNSYHPYAKNEKF